MANQAKIEISSPLDKAKIDIKMVNKNHTPIGVDRCISVTVE
jgi:hypothetical protein